MKRKKTSTFYFQSSCMDVWEAVTSQTKDNGFRYDPLSEEDYEKAMNQSLKNGRALARVTDMTPGKSCAYVVHTEKFDIQWSAEFQDVQGECRMVMTETYLFQKNAVIPYLLSCLFLHQRQQHRAYRQEIQNRLKQSARPTHRAR